VDIQHLLYEKLKHFETAPYLFIGSGLSKRYLNLDDWPTLLQHFCLDIRKFDYYNAKANSDLTKVASQMAIDFYDVWWNNPKYEDSRKNYHLFGEMKNITSPLKFEIMKYIESFGFIDDPNILCEIDELKESTFDAIITTNWDRSLEKLFPDYNVLVGQNDLINTNVKEILEIYKIHGCCSDFNSMVLTFEDYEYFNKKNAYLASKLLTAFIEHPIIFLGYSVNDANIIDILKQISFCLTDNGIESLKDKLYIINRTKGNEENSIIPSSINIGDANLPVTIIKADDYGLIYKALQEYHRKIDIKFLYSFKNQIYDIIKNNDPHNQMGYVDLDRLDNFSDLEVIAGLGIKNRLGQGTIGYERDDFIEDIVNNNRNFVTTDLIETAIPAAMRVTTIIPYFKYLRTGDYMDEKGNIINTIPAIIEKHIGDIKKELNKNKYKSCTAADFSNYNYTITGANNLLFNIKAFGKKNINTDKLLETLKDNYPMYTCSIKSPFGTSYRKTVRVYDWLKYKHNI